MKRGQALPSWRQAVLAVLQSRRRQRQAEAEARGPALVGSILIRRYVKCYRAGTHTAGGCRACGVQ